jgi:predicted outer membrane lipoprotein|tara:strand:+ start:587 stop:853 length:267 start_codon:yes stop_codon:yes gene_type:complete
MVEAAFALALMIALAATFGILNAKSREDLGGERERRKNAESRSNKIIKGIEKLMDPRPTRDVLIKHWERRLSKATRRIDDPSVSDTDD